MTLNEFLDKVDSTIKSLEEQGIAFGSVHGSSGDADIWIRVNGTLFGRRISIGELDDKSFDQEIDKLLQAVKDHKTITYDDIG